MDTDSVSCTNNVSIINEKYKVNLLIQQRTQIQDNIVRQNLFLWKIILTIISSNIVLTMIFQVLDSRVLSSSLLSNIPFLTVFSYLFIQISIVLLLVIMALLFYTNNDRQYITAIDRYLFKKYSITTLFQDGEITKLSVTGYWELFPRTTAAAGFSVLGTYIYMIFGTSLYKYIVSNNLVFLVLLAIEILIIALLFIQNMVRTTIKAKTLESRIEQACFGYLNRDQDPDSWKEIMFGKRREHHHKRIQKKQKSRN